MHPLTSTFSIRLSPRNPRYPLCRRRIICIITAGHRHPFLLLYPYPLYVCEICPVSMLDSGFKLVHRLQSLPVKRVHQATWKLTPMVRNTDSFAASANCCWFYGATAPIPATPGRRQSSRPRTPNVRIGAPSVVYIRDLSEPALPRSRKRKVATPGTKGKGKGVADEDEFSADVSQDDQDYVPPPPRRTSGMTSGKF